MKKRKRTTAIETSIIVLTALVLALTLFSTSSESEENADPVVQPVEAPVQANAAALSGSLDRIVITVDAGHGGYDCGAIGRKTKVLEKDLNLQVAQQLSEKLRQAGATVVTTRDGDYALCPEDTPFGMLKKADMAKRAEIIDSNYTQILISIHMNEDRSSASSGPQVFYQTGNVEGKELAEYLQKALNDGLEPAKKRGVNDGDYFILRHGPPSVLVECGFLSNEREEQLLKDPSYQAKIVSAIFQGVTDYCDEHELVPQGPEPLS